MSHYTKLITLLLIGSLGLNAYLLWPQKQPVVGTHKIHSGKSIKAPKSNLLSQAQQQFTQHKFDDALNTYQQLNLSAPKKSTYFIRFVGSTTKAMAKHKPTA